ncbi:hypothetical protein [Nocardiopsis sp. L17-MgMaSL7]|uniref:hypothetical protein n=1 Tax=Nocardiopsis sp. L17-MgMaSL7 TaxID=1938893 RepID=UPI000D70A829|nr:hypothetical protein [Nocardiopsis sp. L17-MgMaSL7]PWV58114.1 hypothetical protein BDW27_101351 [Nocardiopsis sp. L17-MgMaSL7]
MTGGETFNTAGPHSFVGVQAGIVRDSTIYVVGPDDPPERHFQVGVKYLEHGVPDKARSHIETALSRGHDSPEVRFHLVLAMLSKRSFRDLNRQNRTTLSGLSHQLDSTADDEWNEALNVVFMVLACVDGSEGDPDAAIARLRELPETQRELVMRHLSLVLTGSMKQGIWTKYRDTAYRNRTADGRVNRVWVYFEPDPAQPRAQTPRPKSTTGWDILGAILLTAATLHPLFLLLRAALSHGTMMALLACLTTVVFVPAAGWHVARWNHQRQRIIAAMEEQESRFSRASPPEGGFTDHVERAFDHYFAKYAPDPENRTAWLEETKGVRRALRDEVARIYRESDVRSGQVNWLIRFMVRDVRRRWCEGTPLRPAEIYGLEAMTKVRCIALSLCAAMGSVFVIGSAFPEAPVSTVACLLLLGLVSRFSVPLWLRLHSEQRRYVEEWREREVTLRGREEEYERWWNKLAALMPTEAEMEKWLEADKTLILNQALRHYRLEWHEVIAHAFLPTPDRPCKSTRVKGGPWRFSKYEIRIFLVTNEGVRESSADLDFEGADWHSSERYNYRFDALSSVQVEISNEHRYTLNITLTNGPTKSLVVSEAPQSPARHEEQPEAAAQINLEAAGFPHTLRILEGIAAEGKPWFDRVSEADPPAAA